MRKKHGAQSAGKKLSPAAQSYVLLNASVGALMKMEKSEAVYKAIVSRKNANKEQLAVAMSGLAKLSEKSELEVQLFRSEQRVEALQAEMTNNAKNFAKELANLKM